MASKEFVFGIKIESKEARDGVKKTSSELKAMAKAVEQVDKNIKAMNLDKLNSVAIEEANIKTIQEADKSIQSLDSSIKKLNENNTLQIVDPTQSAHLVTLEADVVNLAGAMDQLPTVEASKNMGKLNNALSFFERIVNTLGSAAEIFSGISNAIEFLSDPSRIKRLAMLTRLLGNIAFFKGNQGIANMMFGVADGLDTASDAIQGFKDSSIVSKLEAMEAQSTKLVSTWKIVAFTADTTLKLAFGGLAIGVARDMSPAFKSITDALANKMMPAMKGVAGQTLNMSKTLKDVRQQTLLYGKLLFSPVIPGVVGLTAELGRVGSVLGFVGTSLTDSENEIIAFGGRVMQITGLILGGMTFFVSTMTSLMGILATSIGAAMIGAIDEFSRKFEKAQAATQQFEFVVVNFGKALGAGVGSLQDWNTFIDATAEGTLSGVGDIRKSVALLIKESQILGLSMKQNQQVISRAVEIAASTGKKLQDVTVGLVSGLAGQGQAALSMGVDLRSAAVSHQALHEGIEGNVDSLDTLTKTQLRFRTLMEQTTPLIGAAALAMNTLEGSEARVATAYSDLTASIGGGSNVTKAMNNILADTLGLFQMIPAAILETLGALIELGGFLLILGGTIVSFAFTYNTIASTGVLINAVLRNNVAVQTAVISALNIMSSSAGVAVGEINSLGGVFKKLMEIMLAGIGPAMKGFVVQMWAIAKSASGAAVAVGRFVISMAPMLIKIGLVVGAIFLLKKGYEAFEAVLGPVGKAMLSAALVIASVSVSLFALNIIIVKSAVVQGVLTAAVMRTSAALGVQGVAVTSVSTLWASFAVIGKAVAASLARGMIPAIMGAIGVLKGMAVALWAVLVPLIPIIIKVALLVGAVVLVISAVDEMSSAFEGFGSVLDGMLLPFAQLVGVAGEATEESEKLGKSVEQTTGFFTRIWNVLKGLVQSAMLPFALVMAVVTEGLLNMKIALTDDEKELAQLTKALDANFDVQAKLVGQMEVSVAGITSLGDQHVIAAKEAEHFGHAMLAAGDAAARAGHDIKLTKAELEGLVNSLASAIGGIKGIEQEIAKIGQTDVSKIKLSAKAKIDEINLLREQLKANDELSDQQDGQLQQKIDLLNKQADLTIEQKKVEELNRITADTLKLEQNVTKEKLSGAAAINKQFEFTTQALDAKIAHLKAEGLLTDEMKAQIEQQKKLAEVSKQTQLVAEASSKTRSAPKARAAKKAPKAAKEKVSDAQRELESLLKNQIGLQRTINEFGKQGADLITMRKNERIKELELLQQTLVAEGKVGTAQVINLAKVREMKLANLKLDAEADKDKKKSDDDKAKAAEKQMQLNQTVADRLKQSDKDLASRTSSRIQMIQTEAIEQHKSVTAEAEKLDAAGQLSPMLARSFAQLKKNNIEAAQFDIKDIKTDSIEALAEETRALVMEGKTEEEQKKESLKLALAAIETKREELKAAGLLTAEAERLLAVQGKEVKKQAQPKDGGIDLEGIGDSIADGFSQGADALAGSFDMISGMMDGLASFGGEEMVTALTDTMESFPEMIVKGMEALPDIIIKAVDSFIDAIDQMIAKMPEMISKILDALPEIINKLFDAFGRLIESLPAMFSQILDALPDIMVQIMEKLPDMILKIFNALGDIISMLLQALPDIIVKFAENIGPIVTALVDGIVSNIGKIIIALIDSFIVKGGVIKIAIALMKAMANLLPAILKGLASAVKNIWKGMFSGFKIPLEVPPAIKELPDKLKNAVSSIGDGIKAGGGDVFALVDLAKSKSAKSIDQSIGQATKKATALFKQTFKTIGGWLEKLWAKLREIWLWVWGILTKLWSELKKVWDLVVMALQALWEVIEAIWDVVVKALQILWDAIEAIWDVVVLALQALWDAIELIWDNVVIAVQLLWDNVEKIFNDFVEGVQAVWDWFKENILDKFAEGIQAVWNWFKTNILDKFASGIQTVFNTLATKGQEAATKISGAITKLPDQARQAAEKLAGAIGALPGKATEFANNVISKLGSIGTTMWNSFTSAFGNMGGVIKNHATWAFDELFRNIKGGFGKIFEGVGGGGTKAIEKLMGTDVPVLAFARGGIVPGTASAPGDSIKNDQVAAFLSPDEAVIPRSLMARPEIKTIVDAILDGNVNFLNSKRYPHSHQSISAPKAPKLPSINDIKKLSPADLAKNLESNFDALKNLATGDLWDMFKDKIFGKVKEMMEGVVKNAAGFEDGGIVPNTGMAMVHENEAVLPTDLVKQLTGNQNSKQTQQITLNATVNMVGADVTGGKQSGKKIIDEMFIELRKRSANQKVMFESGLIS